MCNAECGFEETKKTQKGLLVNMVDLVRKNWHPIMEEQRRWKDLLYVEWNRHKIGHIPEG